MENMQIFYRAFGYDRSVISLLQATSYATSSKPSICPKPSTASSKATIPNPDVKIKGVVEKGKPREVRV